MAPLRFAAVVLLGLGISACGGGGGGDASAQDDTSISLSASSLQFFADEGPFATEPAPQQVTATFRGAGVVVGTLPGQTLPPWLFPPTIATESAGQVVFSLRATPFTVPRGTYTTTLRFVTGRQDQTNLKTADLALTLIVSEPFSATTMGNLSFTQIDGSPTATSTGASTIRIRGGEMAWRATANRPWITLGASSGTQPTDLAVGIDRQGLANGTHSGEIQVIDDRRNRTVTFPVSLEIRPARLSLSTTSLSYDVDPQSLASELERTLLVTDEIGGQDAAKAVSWTAAIDSDWLQLSATAGSSAPGQQLAVRLDPAKLSLLPSGTYTDTLSFAYQSSAGASGSLQIPVTLTLRLPLARAATPYLLTAGAPTTIDVRGVDIQAEDMANLVFDGTLGNVTRVDSTRLQVDLPAHATGDYALRFTNAAGLARSAVSLRVQPAVSIGAGVIHSPNVKRLVFDEQRNRLFAIDRAQFEIERYSWNGATWITEAPLSVAQVADAALSRDGRYLIIAARHALYYVDAADLGASLETVWQRTMSPHYDASLNAIQVNDLGTALLTQTYHFAGISGGSDPLLFDALRRTAPVVVPTPPNGYRPNYELQLAHSPGGRFMMFVNYGTSPASPPEVFDSQGVGPTLLGANQVAGQPGLFRVLQVNLAGTRVLAGAWEVRDTNGALLGLLPESVDRYDDFALLSPDGTRAYRLDRAASAEGELDVHDLTGTPNPNYPSLGRVALPSRIMNPADTIELYPGATLTVAGLTTRDGRFVFLAGAERIVIVDVSAF